MSVIRKPQLFNSAMETGVRSVLILNAAAPRAFDLTYLTWLDHLVVHTGDLEGPPSLHPDIPQRAGELVVRRQVVEEGIRLMQRLHMIDTQYTHEGLLYFAREEASLFAQLVRTPYGKALKDRANWLVGYVMKAGEESLARIIHEKIGRWTVEFQPNAGSVS